MNGPHALKKMVRVQQGLALDQYRTNLARFGAAPRIEVGEPDAPRLRIRRVFDGVEFGVDARAFAAHAPGDLHHAAALFGGDLCIERLDGAANVLSARDMQFPGALVGFLDEIIRKAEGNRGHIRISLCNLL